MRASSDQMQFVRGEPSASWRILDDRLRIGDSGIGDRIGTVGPSVRSNCRIPGVPDGRNCTRSEDA